MTRKVLIIHHLESMWESAYKNVGTSFDELAQKTIKHIKRAKYDSVILTQFEKSYASDEHFESDLVNYVNHWLEYGYGWDSESVSNSEIHHFTPGGNHSELVLIPEWMEDLANEKARVSICGAFDGECIEDLEIALKACKIKFRRIESLIV